DNVFDILNRCYTDLRDAGTLPGVQGPWWKGVLHGMDEILFAEQPLPTDPAQRWLLWRVPFEIDGQAIGGPAGPLPSISELAILAFKRFLAHLGAGPIAQVRLIDEIAHLGIETAAHLVSYASTRFTRQAFSLAMRAVFALADQHIELDDETHHRW